VIRAERSDGKAQGEQDAQGSKRFHHKQAVSRKTLRYTESVVTRSRATSDLERSRAPS
jgi:hypothetical protein